MKIDKPKNFNGFLKVMRQFFNDPNVGPLEKEKVWDVLSALRGPDTDYSYSEKDATTAIIRYTVLGYEAKDYGLTNTDQKLRVEFRNCNKFTSNHFQEHAQWAFEALGLSWDKLNK